MITPSERRLKKDLNGIFAMFFKATPHNHLPKVRVTSLTAEKYDYFR